MFYREEMTALGDYLRGRRAAVRPEDVGLRSTGTRRVAGLRREEVALLAGVSVDYYVRLEQGRERSPSTQVLAAIAAALRLDDDGRTHLFRLAGLIPRPVDVQVPDRVDPALQRLMDGWPDKPALVFNRAYDVVAANPIAAALFADVGLGNFMTMVFLNPRARLFFADWVTVAADAVAGFRMGHGAAPSDPQVQAILTELLTESAEFADMWSLHDARGKSLTVKTFRHSQLGKITLKMQAFDVRSSPGQELIVYDAEPGSPDEDALRMLGSLAATG